MNAFAEAFAREPVSHALPEPAAARPFAPRHGVAMPFNHWPGAQHDHGSIVDLLPQAILLAQEDRTLLATNPTARRLMEEGSIRLCDGHLISLGQLGMLQLSRLLGQAAGGGALDCAVWFERCLSTGLLHLSRSRHPLVELAGMPPSGAVLLVVQVDQPALTQCARIDALTRKCRLSPAERYVLMLLADGMTVDLAAKHLSLQLSTVRSHVRNLLGKTQTPSLMQLLRWTGSAQALPH